MRLSRLLETSMPSVFAAGDVRRDSVKWVPSVVEEDGVATLLVHRYLANYDRDENL